MQKKKIIKNMARNKRKRRRATAKPQKQTDTVINSSSIERETAGQNGFTIVKSSGSSSNNKILFIADD